MLIALGSTRISSTLLLKRFSMPNQKPNQKGLHSFREKRRKDIVELVTKTVSNFVRAKKDVNFNSISKKTGVSAPTLYKIEEVRGLIGKYRNQKTNAILQNAKSSNCIPNDEASVYIEALKKNNNDLRAENVRLKKRIEYQNSEIQQLKKF